MPAGTVGRVRSGAAGAKQMEGIRNLNVHAAGSPSTLHDLADSLGNQLPFTPDRQRCGRRAGGPRPARHGRGGAVAALLADPGDAILAWITTRGTVSFGPPHPGRAASRPIDRCLYK